MLASICCLKFSERGKELLRYLPPPQFVGNERTTDRRKTERRPTSAAALGEFSRQASTPRLHRRLVKSWEKHCRESARRLGCLFRRERDSGGTLDRPTVSRPAYANSCFFPTLRTLIRIFADSSIGFGAGSRTQRPLKDIASLSHRSSFGRKGVRQGLPNHDGFRPYQARGALHGQ